MTVPFMSAYVRLLIQTCHKYALSFIYFNSLLTVSNRRKVAAMGGMSAQIPIKDDPKANEIAMEKVRSDKLREVTAGHDGTWIAHPLIHKVARDIFDLHMLGPNQYYNLRAEVKVTAADLLNSVVPGKITVEGIRSNVETCLAYCAAWVGGNGCIPLNYLMEDAATAEITRVQLWQWVHYAQRIDDGRPITVEMIDRVIEDVKPGLVKLVRGLKQEDVKIAVEYLKEQIRGQWPSEFLTSDLMGWLAFRDGVGPGSHVSAHKASL